jgi:hypothetical protein
MMGYYHEKLIESITTSIFYSNDMKFCYFSSLAQAAADARPLICIFSITLYHLFREQGRLIDSTEYKK